MWDKLRILREQYIDQGIMDSIDYEKFCMISIVYNSSKIEGCSLTETDTKVLLRDFICRQQIKFYEPEREKFNKIR